MEKFMIGLAVGAAAGALLVAGNCKLRQLVNKSKDEAVKAAESFLESKVGNMQSCNAQKQEQKKDCEDCRCEGATEQPSE